MKMDHSILLHLHHLGYAALINGVFRIQVVTWLEVGSEIEVLGYENSLIEG